MWFIQHITKIGGESGVGVLARGQSPQSAVSSPSKIWGIKSAGNAHIRSKRGSVIL